MAFVGVQGEDAERADGVGNGCKVHSERKGEEGAADVSKNKGESSSWMEEYGSKVGSKKILSWSCCFCSSLSPCRMGHSLYWRTAGQSARSACLRRTSGHWWRTGSLRSGQGGAARASGRGLFAAVLGVAGSLAIEAESGRLLVTVGVRDGRLDGDSSCDADVRGELVQDGDNERGQLLLRIAESLGVEPVDGRDGGRVAEGGSVLGVEVQGSGGQLDIEGHGNGGAEGNPSSQASGPSGWPSGAGGRPPCQSRPRRGALSWGNLISGRGSERTLSSLSSMTKTSRVLDLVLVDGARGAGEEREGRSGRGDTAVDTCLNVICGLQQAIEGVQRVQARTVVVEDGFLVFPSVGREDGPDGCDMKHSALQNIPTPTQFPSTPPPPQPPRGISPSDLTNALCITHFQPHQLKHSALQNIPTPTQFPSTPPPPQPPRGISPSHLTNAPCITNFQLHQLTANVSTEGTNGKFPVWDVFEELPITQWVVERFS
ncbi:hypothetical protein DFH06DRAFT_1149133 [Mycena polygramma]|nr:hypothetical protein DFH06DRAFT_1149133 [Mycena polygramma]